MERFSKECCRPEIVARNDVKRRPDNKQPANHGFFNAHNAGLRDVPCRAWGRMPAFSLPGRSPRPGIKF